MKTQNTAETVSISLTVSHYIYRQSVYIQSVSIYTDSQYIYRLSVYIVTVYYCIVILNTHLCCSNEAACHINTTKYTV